ncbi:MAG: patatin-like phospholipase family protein [candidate division KSB1 bacterium]|nr:patatin-like phospholipase family protein [candidate division KSB1 bacterium]MDZ7276467.1 patatin-like phospholipase family protein [candidate division KSB1 bacterium]MDZ7286752.1 patatin-like phospholipase family protein [candidate division KSB1 bacterium]MDZ7300237.1 patatin-like phospholipase family protein [candidate division KSB1 bacterium]MDZ7306743.1 patatin-like phospholipase family protein [candidate division KSB1 bacterium]
MIWSSRQSVAASHPFAFVFFVAAFVAITVGFGRAARLPAADSSRLRPGGALVFTPRLGKLVRPPHAFVAFHELAHPRVGLALSGGGSRCLAQIGVLQALEEHEVGIDLIVGTSMGSIIGGLYAAGYSARQLREIVHQLDWETLLRDEPQRRDLLLSQKQEHDRTYLQVRLRGWKPAWPRALTAGQKLQSVLTELTLKANYWASSSFDNLRIPFRAVATDVNSGREVLIDRGDLAEAMRASAAIPFLLSPVPRQNHLLVDGGLLNNIPVDVVRRMGMEVVIAVDATSNLRSQEHLSMPWEFADQVTTIMQQERNREQAARADVLISLREEPRPSLDFSRLDSLIELGYQKTLAQMDRIRRLCGQVQASAANGAAAPYAVRHFAVRGVPVEALPLAGMGNGGGRLSAEAIQQQVDQLYASGDYRRVSAVLRNDTLYFEAESNPVLRSLRFEGNTVYSDLELFACLQSRLGERLNHLRGRRDLTNLLEKYRQEGYALAEIRSVEFDSSNGALVITVEEGRIADIVCEGLVHTRAFVAQREFTLERGEIFNSKAAQQSVVNLHNTGLFEKVGLSLVRLPDGSALVKFKVEEKPYTLLRLGIFSESERGTRVFAEVGNENLFGTGTRLLWHGNLGERDQVARLSWYADRFAHTYLNLATSVYHELRENLTYLPGHPDPRGAYDERRWGVRASLGQQVSRLGGIALELRSEEVRLRSLSGSGYPVGTARLNSLTLRSILDTRDQFPFTRTGRYLHLAYEYFRPFDGGLVTFSKFQAQLESFDSAGPHTLRYRFVLGAAEETTPFSEQFKLGGPHDLYGLRDQEFVGRHLLLGSMEYRYQLRKRPLLDTYLSLRYDWGGVWVDRKDTSYRKIRNGIGMALTVATPLGPAGVAVGLFEGRQKRVYFQFGHAF